MVVPGSGIITGGIVTLRTWPLDPSGQSPALQRSPSLNFIWYLTTAEEEHTTCSLRL